MNIGLHYARWCDNNNNNNNNNNQYQHSTASPFPISTQNACKRYSTRRKKNCILAKKRKSWNGKKKCGQKRNYIKLNSNKTTRLTPIPLSARTARSERVRSSRYPRPANVWKRERQTSKNTTRTTESSKRNKQKRNRNRLTWKQTKYAKSEEMAVAPPPPLPPAT